MLSVKHRGIKYHFFSLWYDSNWDLTLVSCTIGEYSNHYSNGLALLVDFHKSDSTYFIFKNEYITTYIQ